MQCPHCDSSEVRKASAVYEEGTSIAKSRTRGVGLGIGGRPTGLGIAGFGAKTQTRSSTLAARKADRARIRWIGAKEGLALFVLFWAGFASIHLGYPFSKAATLTIAIMVACPVVTAILAVRANQDYDDRWFCNACGEVWTNTAGCQSVN